MFTNIARLFKREPKAWARLCDDDQIQTAFRQEFQLLLREVGAPSDLVPEKGVIDGLGLLTALNSLEPETLPNLGFKPEHVKVLKTLIHLLAQCSRLKATKENIAIAKHLFHPAKPTTPTVADAFEEVVGIFVDNIG